MHKYAVQITVADVRDGACSHPPSRSVLLGARSMSLTKMVFAEATTVVPLNRVGRLYRAAGCRGQAALAKLSTRRLKATTTPDGPYRDLSRFRAMRARPFGGGMRARLVNWLDRGHQSFVALPFSQ